MAEQRTQLQVLESIEGKLDLLVAAMLVRDKDQDEQIAMLRDRGLDWATIGLLVGLKPNAARMRLANRGKQQKAKKDGQEG